MVADLLIPLLILFFLVGAVLFGILVHFLRGIDDPSVWTPPPDPADGGGRLNLPWSRSERERPAGSGRALGDRITLPWQRGEREPMRRGGAAPMRRPLPPAPARGEQTAPARPAPTWLTRSPREASSPPPSVAGQGSPQAEPDRPRPAWQGEPGPRGAPADAGAPPAPGFQGDGDVARVPGTAPATSAPGPWGGREAPPPAPAAPGRQGGRPGSAGTGGERPQGARAPASERPWQRPRREGTPRKRAVPWLREKLGDTFERRPDVAARLRRSDSTERSPARTPPTRPPTERSPAPPSPGRPTRVRSTCGGSGTTLVHSPTGGLSRGPCPDCQG